MNYNHTILKILNKFDKPVGASQIKRELKKYGSEISEATIGRVLFQLDGDGYTYRDGYRGRLITSKGIEYIEEQDKQEFIKMKSNMFLSVLDISKTDELLEALEARKILESQIAKYAARRCNLQAKRDLHLIIESHEMKLKGIDTYSYNVPFHKYIATLAKNRILEHMLELVIDDTRFTPLLKKIEKGLGPRTINEHKMIAKAIIDKNEVEAEAAMAIHIESLIEQVKRYKNNSSQETF